MGAARSYLLRDGLVQAVVVLGASIGVGGAVGVGLGGLISGSDVPFAIEAPAVTVAGLLLAVVGLIGAAFAIVRVAAIDPLTALGAQR
jgi:putative ABC transport system permease protein